MRNILAMPATLSAIMFNNMSAKNNLFYVSCHVGNHVDHLVGHHVHLCVVISLVLEYPLEYFSHWLGSHNKYDDDGDIAWLALFRFPD